MIHAATGKKKTTDFNGFMVIFGARNLNTDALRHIVCTKDF